MRYYFNIRDQYGVVLDDEGTELPDLEAARQEAHASARDFVMDALRSGPSVKGRRIEIADSESTVLESVTILDIVK